MQGRSCIAASHAHETIPAIDGSFVRFQGPYQQDGEGDQQRRSVGMDASRHDRDDDYRGRDDVLDG